MSPPGQQVLIVEDDRVDRLACRRALSREAGTAYAIHECDTGTEGLRLARELAPTLILLDYHLPDLDGLEFLQALAGHRNEPGVPVVMLTGADSTAVAVAAMKRGARDFLVKDSERRYLELLPTVVERVLREERLMAGKREAEARLRLVADGVPGLLAYVDRDLRYRFNNARYLECFGLDPENLYGRTIREVLGEALYEEIRPRLAAVLTGVPQSYESTVIVHGDARRYLYVRLLPHLEGREVIGFYVIAMDITELKQAQRELAARRDELAHLQRLQTAGTLASSIAHEVNQPLQAVMAYCEAARRLLAGGGCDQDKLVHALDQAVKQAQYAAQVIQHLRTFLRKGGTEAVALDLNELVHSAVGLLEAEDCTHGFRIETDLAAGALTVIADRVHVEQVLLNLLRNSAEALCAANLRDGRIAIRTFVNAEGAAQTSVRDTGPGIEPGMHKRLFEAFHTSKPSGLGMGLSISRTLVEAHGGRLWADAGGGPGATFHFTLPSSP